VTRAARSPMAADDGMKLPGKMKRWMKSTDLRAWA
jgi:hypothetical protein